MLYRMNEKRETNQTVIRKNIEKLMMMEKKTKAFPVRCSNGHDNIQQICPKLLLFQKIENIHLRSIIFIVRFILLFMYS